MSTYVVFVYGTLKQGQPNHYLLTDESKGAARYIASGRTSTPFPLVISSEYNIPFLLYKKGLGKMVEGEIYEIDETMLKTLDELEIHPTFYEREQTTIVLTEDNQDENSSGQRECWCYFLKKIKPALLDLPTYDSYDCNGSHGLKYATRYERNANVGYNILLDVQGQ